jgi:hypothetical protein
MVRSQMPLGACVRGSSAWIIWQLVRDSLQSRIHQFERDPGVHPGVVRQLRGTATDLEEAARLYREWASCSAAEAIEAPPSGLEAVLDRPSGLDTGSVATSLGCSERWVTQLCLTGRLVAVKVGRVWSIDPDSVREYKKGADAA